MRATPALSATGSDRSTTPGMPVLAMPVLAIGGERTMRQVATDVRGAVVPACGRYPAEERPAELAAMLTRYFDEVASREARRVDERAEVATLRPAP